VLQVDLLERALPALAQERRQEIRDGEILDPALDFGLGDNRRDVLPVAQVDLLGRELDVSLGRLLLLIEERLEVLAQLVEDARLSAKPSRMRWTIASIFW